jgi:hypothetical protein
MLNKILNIIDFILNIYALVYILAILELVIGVMLNVK